MIHHHVAIASCQEVPDLWGGECLLPPALRALGVQTSVCIWDDPAVRWQDFEAVVVRCTWDYHLKLPAFLAWLAALERLQVPLINDVDTLRANVDKTYLLALQSAGLSVIPSLCLQPEDDRSVSTLMDVMGFNEVVVKPTRSAGAWRTLHLKRGGPAQLEAEFSAWRLEQEFLMQPFMPEVVRGGEWSLVYFDGVFSHAVLKRAKSGDFRVQSLHGGTAQLAMAPPGLAAQGLAILNTLSTMPCYARVDGVVRDDQFLLMELELVEPELFLELEAGAPKALAIAIQKRLNALAQA